VKRIAWTEPALADLDKAVARRIKRAVERFAETGAGNVKKLHGIDPPEYRLRVSNWRARFDLEGETVRVLRVRNRSEAYR
jgi:mRNA-degrading endonuclease RelE of RelBE toxin-antitoxin system